MSHKITVPFPSPITGLMENKEGLLMDITSQNEVWSEYTLEDETIIRVKQTIVQIVKFEPLSSSEDPQYAVQAQPIISVIPKK